MRKAFSGQTDPYRLEMRDQRRPRHQYLQRHSPPSYTSRREPNLCHRLPTLAQGQEASNEYVCRASARGLLRYAHAHCSVCVCVCDSVNVCLHSPIVRALLCIIYMFMGVCMYEYDLC